MKMERQRKNAAVVSRFRPFERSTARASSLFIPHRERTLNEKMVIERQKRREVMAVIGGLH
jgi:hypothetical protein